MKQRTQEITQLSEMSHLLQSCHSAEEAGQVVIQFGRSMFSSESGTLYLLDPGRKFCEAVAAWGESSGGSCERAFQPDECWALRRGRPHVAEDDDSGPRCKHMTGFRSAGYLCAPMMAQGEPLGVLNLRWPQRGRGEARAPLETRKQAVVAMADNIALTLSNLRLHESLKEQSVRDQLTGLFNRRYLEESLEREVRRASRSAGSIGIIMLDLDRFKQFNDNFGHPAGDAILRALGRYLGGNVRGEDIPSRYGGEEFTLVLPGASLQITLERAERLRAGAQSLRVMADLESPTRLAPITLSLGVAAFPQHGTKRDVILRAADEALLRAKQEGRNRVEVAAEVKVLGRA